MLYFQLAKLYNFGPYKKATVPLNKCGFVLVTGSVEGEEGSDSNGAGKTMIFEALSWAIFEKTSKGFSHDDVIRDGSKRGCRVDIIGKLDDKKFEIRRTRKHPKYGTDLRIFIDGVDESKSTIRETQKYIISLLGYSYETFVNSTYFPQETATFFSNVTDKKRKELLEKILGFEAFSRAKEAAATDRRKFRAEVDLVAGEIVIKQHDLTECEETQERLRKMDKTWRSDHAQAVARIKSKIKNFVRIIKESQIEIDRGSLLLCPPEDSLEARRVELKIRQLDKTLLIREDAEIRAKISSLKEKIAEIKQSLSDSLDIGAICDRCGSRITQSTAAAFRENLEGRLDAESENLKLMKQTHRQHQKSLTDAEERIAEKEREIEDIHQLTQDARERDREIERLAQKRDEHKQFLKEAKEELKKAEDEEPPFSILLNRQKEKEETLRGEIKTLEKSERTREKKLRCAEFWEHGFGDQGLKNVLLETALTYLEQQINEILSRATQGSMNVKIKGKKKLKTKKAGKIPVRKKIDFIVYRNGKRRTYTQLSGGQRKRINIASLLSLRHLSFLGSGKPTNILILDELFTSLDSSGVELVMQILQNEKAESIFLSSHRPLNSAGFDGVWEAKMRGDISRLEIA